MIKKIVSVVISLVTVVSLSVFIYQTRAMASDFVIPVGNQPSGIVLDSVTNELYVTNTDSGTVSVINGATNTVTSTIIIGGYPGYIAVDPTRNKIYVTSQSGVSVINGATNTVTSTITLGVDPLGIAINPTTNNIYVIGNQGGNTPGIVLAIDGATDTVTSTITLGVELSGIAINPTTNNIYVIGNQGGNTPGIVLAIDGATDTVTSTLTVGVCPCDIAANPIINEIYVTNSGSGTVSVIDGTTNVVTSTLTVGSKPWAIALDTGTNEIYVTNSGSGTISVIDGATNTVTPIMSVGFYPLGIAINPTINEFYILLQGEAFNSPGSVMVISGTSMQVLPTINVGTNPYGVAVNPSTNTVYVTNSISNTVSVIDGINNTVTGTIVVGSYPEGIAVDPTTNTIYVANNQSNTVSVIDGANNTTTATIGVGANPEGIAVDPITDTIYVADNGSGDVDVIDGATNTLTTTIDLGLYTYPVGIAVDTIDDDIYVTEGFDGNIVFIDGIGNYIFNVSPMNVALGGVATNDITDKVYVADNGSTGLSVFPGGQSDPQIDGAATYNNPFGVAVDATTNMIYVTDSGSGEVSLIDGASNNTISNFFVGNNPLGIAVNPNTNEVYVANNGSGTVSVIKGPLSSIPDAPSNVNATPGNLSATVSWDPPLASGSSPISSYAVGLYPAGGSTPIIKTFPGTIYSTVFTNLVPGLSYNYSVTATNIDGSGIPFISSSAVIPYWTPDAPTNVTATAGNATAVLTWTAPNSNASPISDYIITPSTGAAIDTHSTNTSYKMTGLINGTAYSFKVTAVNIDGNSPASQPSNTVVPQYLSGDYFPVTPVRIVDTRVNSGYSGQSQTLNPAGTFTLDIAGNYGIPANATVVSLNVTVTDTTSSGYMTVYPDGVSTPDTSNLNWSVGETKANLVEATIGSDGKIDFFNKFGSTDLVVDLEGYYMPSTGSSGLYNPIVPTRICDTRNTTNQCSDKTLIPGGTLDVQVTGNGVVPYGAEAVVVNITATNTTAWGFLSVSPSGSTQTSALNWQTGGDTVSNRIIATLSTTGSIVVSNAFGNADVILDVTGYYSGAAGTGLSYTGINPVRLVDTRQSSGYTDQGMTLQGGASLSVQIAETNNIPANIEAAVINVTATDTTSWGYLTVAPNNAISTSDVNWTGAGQTIPNLDIATLSSSGSVIITNGSTAPLDIIIDVVGYYQ